MKPALLFSFFLFFLNNVHAQNSSRIGKMDSLRTALEMDAEKFNFFYDSLHYYDESIKNAMQTPSGNKQQTLSEISLLLDRRTAFVNRVLSESQKLRLLEYNKRHRSIPEKGHAYRKVQAEKRAETRSKNTGEK